MHRRDLRGLISRPTVAETYRFRESIDEHVERIARKRRRRAARGNRAGLHARPASRATAPGTARHRHQARLRAEPALSGFSASARRRQSGARSRRSVSSNFDEATIEIGHDGDGFTYDNEGPRHRALVPAFSLANRPVTNGEYLAFIEAGGYARPEFWLSFGWTTVNEQRWQAPLYWMKRDGAGGISHFPACARSTKPSRSRTSAISKPTRSRTGAARGCRPNSNGNAPPPDLPIEGNFVDTRALSSRAGCRLRRNEKAAANVWRRLGMDAQRLSPLPRLSRRARRARRIQRQIHVQPDGAARRIVRHIARATSARPTAISFNRKNAGNSPASGSRAIRHERRSRRGHRARSRAGDCGFSRRGVAGLSSSPRIAAVQVFLRRARRGSVPENLRTARILRHPHRDRDPAATRRRNGRVDRRQTRS